MSFWIYLFCYKFPDFTRLPFCLFQHGLRKDAVPPGGVVDQHMGDCPHQAAVLHDGAPAHPLHDAARLGQQFPVHHPEDMLRRGSASLIFSILTR